jgi:branched-chain amino acid transport system substrate-binding protein
MNMQIPIGVVGPLTGPRAEYGNLLRKAAFAGAALALHERPGGRTAQLFFDDDAADPVAAREAARRLISAGVEAVVGHYNSDAAAAAGPLYHAAGIPLLLPAATRDGLAREIGAFRLCATDADQVSALATALAGTNGFALACDSTQYAARLAAGLRAHKLTLGRVRVKVDLGGDVPRGADPIVFLGTHRAVLDALERWQALGYLVRRRLLACDDCSIPTFAASLPLGLEIRVATPVPGFAAATRDAVALAIRYAQGERGALAQSLAADARFRADGDSASARFQLIGERSVPISQ